MTNNKYIVTEEKLNIDWVDHLIGGILFSLGTLFFMFMLGKTEVETGGVIFMMIIICAFIILSFLCFYYVIKILPKYKEVDTKKIKLRKDKNG